MFQFLFWYLGSAFILFTIIAYLFYQIESRFFIDSTKHEMEQKASRLSAQIIHAHMMRSPFSLEQGIQSDNLRIALYDANHQALTAQTILLEDWDTPFQRDSNRAVLIDQSTFGHLGVEIIVIEKTGLESYTRDLLRHILFILFSSYLVVTFVGYFLAKLFIKPIQMKRISLDNFIKDSTHELNTPITTLMLSLNAPQLTSEKNIERIRLSAKRIADIYQDLTYLILDDHLNEREVQPLWLNELFHHEVNYLVTPEKPKRSLNLGI